MDYLASRLRSLVHWAVVTKTDSDNGDYPVRQIGYMGKVSKAVMWFPFGFHANVSPDALALTLSSQSNSEAKISLPGSSPQRPLVTTGEVVVYHPKSGSKIHFKDDGSIVMTSAVQVTIDAPTTTVTGDLNVEGNIDASMTMTVSGNVAVDPGNLTVAGSATLGSTVTSGGTDISDTHTHVSAGSGNSSSTPE